MERKGKEGEEMNGLNSLYLHVVDDDNYDIGTVSFPQGHLCQQSTVTIELTHIASTKSRFLFDRMCLLARFLAMIYQTMRISPLSLCSAVAVGHT